MRNLIRTLPLLIFLCLAFAAETRADPLLVTGGSASVEGVTGGPFNLIGNGFVLNGSMQWGHAACSPACRGGETINVRTVNSGFDLFGGPAVVGGMSYGLDYDGILIFEAGFVMPNETSNLFTLTTPFAFHGFLLGCTHDPITGCAPGDTIFNSSLIGQGTATLTIQSFDAGSPFGRLYQLQGVRYDFAPTPTPEPATMVLLGTGLAGIGAAVRRRRRKISRDKSS